MNQIRPISKEEYEDLKLNNIINEDTLYAIKEELSDTEKLEKIYELCTNTNKDIAGYVSAEDIIEIILNIGRK